MEKVWCDSGERACCCKYEENPTKIFAHISCSTEMLEHRSPAYVRSVNELWISGPSWHYPVEMRV